MVREHFRIAIVGHNSEVNILSLSCGAAIREARNGAAFRLIGHDRRLGLRLFSPEQRLKRNDARGQSYRTQASRLCHEFATAGRRNPRFCLNAVDSGPATGFSTSFQFPPNFDDGVNDTLIFGGVLCLQDEAPGL
jgi:hypothetical protein